MTRPDVLINRDDGDEPPRALPVWLRRGASAAVVVVLLAVYGVRLAQDRQRHQALLAAQDAVAAVVSINESGLGVGGSVVVGIQVSGRGGQLRVDAPRFRPDAVARTSVVGAPLVVAAHTGNQIRVHLQPDCDRVLGLARFDVELPVTPASGKQHVLRLAFTDGPALLRRACGYLPVDEALTTTSFLPLVVGDRLQLHLGLSNDSRQLLTVVGIGASGLDVQADLPAELLPRGASVDLPLVVRVRDCGALARGGASYDLALTGQLADPEGRRHQVALPVQDPVTAIARAFLAARCD